MADSQRQNGAYTKSEMVRVVVDEQVLADPVPETWIGTDLLPVGAKKATKAQVAKADGTDDADAATPAPAPAPVDPSIEPARNGSREAWAAYAKATQGATDADLVDGDGKDLGRDELVAKYGSPSS